jgi:Mg2+ and Co2+ transporter CorA
MGSFDDVLQGIQDLLAPELRGIPVRLDTIDKRLKSMQESQTETRNELRASEARMLRAIEQTKTEVLLTTRGLSWAALSNRS